MASLSSRKKSRTKPPKSRPQATSALSQPLVEDASTSTVLSSFSLRGDLFAFLSLAVDKHRLRVYDVSTSQSVAEYVVDGARVTALAWIDFDHSDGPATSLEDAPSKKRKKRASLAADASTSTTTPSSQVQVIALGLSDGTSQLFSPTHGRVVRTLSHPSSTAAILAIVAGGSNLNAQTIWTSGADSTIRSWNARRNEVVGSWKNDDRIPYSAMAVRPGSEEDGRTSILTANHSIHLLSASSDPSAINLSGTEKPQELCSFTGHASAVNSLRWEEGTVPPTRFFSAAEGDRFVYVWDIPDPLSSEGQMAASIPLDSDVRHISLATSAGRQTLLTVSNSGKITLSPVPSELSAPASSKKSVKHKIPTLLPRSTISVIAKKNAADVKVIAATFLAGQDGRIRLARSSGGIKLAFDVVQYIDDAGEFIPEVIVEHKNAAAGLATDVNGVGAPHNRYSEPSNLAVTTGEQMGQDPTMDDLATRDIDGDLDVDLAELSLGQRLTALSGANSRPGQRSSGSDQDQELGAPAKSTKRNKRNNQKQQLQAVPANSLSRMLIQALHSSDAGLLETCLAHSNEALIQNTVRKLPAQLAVPLLTSCVERLGRGGRGGAMKGRGGGASSQRGMGLVNWIKAVLTVHSGHLMTMPDLVARLSGLHATLTTRLTLQERLLSLSGRLDLVLSQIELRSSVAPAPLVPRKNTKNTAAAAQAKREPQRYVEGESSDEDEQMDVEVEDGGDDTGSVQDIELGGDSQEDDSEEDEDEDEDVSDEEDDEDEEGGRLVNGFIDDEAEEDYEDDESEGDSE